MVRSLGGVGSDIGVDLSYLLPPNYLLVAFGSYNAIDTTLYFLC